MAAGIRIGGGSAFFNDRLDAAVELVEKGEIDVLMLETLAERTLALLHVAKRQGGAGYWARLKDRLEVLLPLCHARGTVLVTNGGGADPVACGRMIAQLAKDLGLPNLTIAVVTGDDVTDLVLESDANLAETGEPVSRLGTPIIAANAYLGGTEIAAACAAGAQVVVTGRVADSSLALGPAMARLGFAAEDYDAVASGVLAGHLLECGGHVTGGYFAEPGLKEVPDLDRLGFPIAEIRSDHSVMITKPPGSGGRVDRNTVIEQLLYEMHDPARYLTPDITLDITDLEVEESGPDEVRLTGARGLPPPKKLKALVGVDNGVLVEAEISYAGLNAAARARLAADTLKARIRRAQGLGNLEVRFDVIGLNSLWPNPGADEAARDLRLRVAARVDDIGAAERLICEVESLYVNGPAGGGGVRFSARPTIRSYTAFLPRAQVPGNWHFIGAP